MSLCVRFLPHVSWREPGQAGAWEWPSVPQLNSSKVSNISMRVQSEAGKPTAPCVPQPERLVCVYQGLAPTSGDIVPFAKVPFDSKFPLVSFLPVGSTLSLLWLLMFSCLFLSFNQEPSLESFSNLLPPQVYVFKASIHGACSEVPCGDLAAGRSCCRVV